MKIIVSLKWTQGLISSCMGCVEDVCRGKIIPTGDVEGSSETLIMEKARECANVTDSILRDAFDRVACPICLAE